MNEISLNEFVDRSLQKSQLKNEASSLFSLENPSLLEINLRKACWAKAGTVLGYQGVISFKGEDLSRGGAVARWFAGGIPQPPCHLLWIQGVGRLYLADRGKRVHILRLQDEVIHIADSALLAFEPTLQLELDATVPVPGSLHGGLFGMRLSGTGAIAFTSQGAPIALRVTGNTPAITDPEAVVAWSDDLRVEALSALQMGRHVLAAGAEMPRLEMTGHGWVLIQSSEVTESD